MLERLFTMTTTRTSLLRDQMVIFILITTIMEIHTQLLRRSLIKKYTGLLAQLVQEVQKEKRETKDTRDQQDRLVTLVDKDLRVNKDVRDHKVHRVLQDVLERLDQKESQE